MNITEVLSKLSPHAVLVGSAAKGDEWNDLDLIVNEKGLAIAKELLKPWQSVFPGQVTGMVEGIQVEAMRYWYGPEYPSLRRRKLSERQLFGVSLKAWPVDP